jgi:hypothetical protein
MKRFRGFDNLHYFLIGMIMGIGLLIVLTILWSLIK